MNRPHSSPKVSAPSKWRAENRRAVAVCLGLAAITFAVFAQTVTHKFVAYDDDDYVYNNPMVAGGLTAKGFVWAFTRYHAANWHPLTWISHMADCQLYGLNPAGHHLTNVVLHCATVILLFLVLRRMTGAFWPGAFVAAVFAIHPLRAESVAWVAERKDVLSGLLFVLTVGAHARYARRPSPGRYGLVAVLFALGLMAKPMLVTAPLVLLLLDYWPLRRSEATARLIIEKIPLLALSAACCVVTMLAQHAQWGTGYSLPLRLGNALVTCMIYLGQMVWPAGLAVFYPYPRGGFPWWELALAGVLLAGLTSMALWRRRKQPWILAGWLWYLVMLLPVIGLIQAGEQSHADRYTYLPQIGIYIAVSWTFAEWAARTHARRWAVGALMAGVVGVLMVCATIQTTYWADSKTLWTHALACTTGNYVAEMDLGDVYDREGNPAEAMVHFREALKINSKDAQSRNNLANDLRQTGQLDEAIAQFQQAIHDSPNDVETHYNYAIALGVNGQAEQEIAQYEEALRIDPNHTGALVNLATALIKEGRLDEAIPHLQKALRIDSSLVQAHHDLGNAFMQKGDMADAIPQFQQAAQLEPSDPWVKNNLAWMLATCPEASLRDGDQAVDLASQANNVTGGENPIILHTLAAALAEAGRYSEAVETAQHALRLADSQSKTKLAAALESEIKLYQSNQPFHSSPQAK